MSLVLTPPAQTVVPVAGGRSFPVHRIYCVGRNYVEHAKEMGHTGREPPFFFLKPADAALPVAEGQTGEMMYPSQTANLHHEVELVCAIGESGVIVGWAVGCDLTRRDLQAEAKTAGRPWDAAKGFDQSAPCGSITPGALPSSDGAIRLSVNGETRQDSVLNDMILNPDRIVAAAAALWSLQPGDLIFTGTPSGVGPVQADDRVVVTIDGLETLSFEIQP